MFSSIGQLYKLATVSKGELIVESPEQAIIDFTKTKIDHLYFGSFVVNKK